MMSSHVPNTQLIPDRATAAPTTTFSRLVPNQANQRGTLFLTQGGVCVRRAPKSRSKTCTVGGYTNQSKGGGVCRRHRAKVKKCSVVGCSNVSGKAGLCIWHVARKRPCRAEGCTNNARKGGVCIAHDPKEKLNLCREEGCAKLVWKEGACWGHREGGACSVGGRAVGAQQDGAGGGHGAGEPDSDDLGAKIYRAVMLRRQW